MSRIHIDARELAAIQQRLDGDLLNPRDRRILLLLLERAREEAEIRAAYDGDFVDRLPKE